MNLQYMRSTFHYNTYESASEDQGLYILHELWNDKIHIHVFEDHPNNTGKSVTNCIEFLVNHELHRPLRSSHSFFFERSESSIDFIEKIDPGPSWTHITMNDPDRNIEDYAPVLEEFVLAKLLAGYKGIHEKLF